MKILYIIPSLELGGAEILLINHINKLNLKVYKPILLIVGNKGSLVNQLHNEVDVIKINATKSDYLFKLPKIVLTINSIKPDVIHSHLFKANLLARFVSIFTNAIVINHYHGLSRWMSKPKLFFDKITQPLMHYGIVVSNKSYELRLNREKIIPSKLKLVYNFINQFPEDIKIDDFKEKALTLGMACRLIPLKNIPSVIKLIVFLKNRGLDINLEIAGSGPEYGEIDKMINRLGLTDNVKLLGFQSDLSEFYKKIDVYIVASETEDLPLSLSEAMSYGCTVISSDVGGIKSVVEQGEGLIVNEFNDIEFQNIMNYLNQDNFKNSFTLNRSVARKLFHYDVYSKAFDQIYSGK